MRNRRIVLLMVETVLLTGILHGISGIEVKGAQADSGNLVLDSGFEALEGGEGPLVKGSKEESWKQGPQGGWESDTANPYQGKNSLKATEAWSWLYQEVAAVPGKHYVLEAYVRSDIAILKKEDHYNTFLTLECLDSKEELIGRDWGIVNATSWWQTKRNLILALPDARRIRIKLAKRQGEGSVWFDEVKLLEMPPSSFPNSGFEILNGEGKPSPWVVDNRGGWSASHERPYEGRSSMRATIGWSWLYQDIQAKPNTYYSLEAYLRADMTVRGNAFLTLECFDADGVFLKRDWGVMNATTGWGFKRSIILTPPGTMKIRMKLAKRQGEGSVWFDNLKLVRHWISPLPWSNCLFYSSYFSIYGILVVSFLLRMTLKKLVFTKKKTGRLMR